MDTALLDDDVVGDGGSKDDEAPRPEGDGQQGADAAGGDSPVARPVHRLRDLDRRGRLIAALLAFALALSPLLAFAWAAPDWTPANDPALMALRSLDVGSNRTPLTGQPSTSAHYTSDQEVVDHPGPIHFYAMAAPIRLMGAALGMLTVSLAIVAGCVLISAWALFRQLGPTGGVVGAVVLGTITFTTGASSLVNPVSSNIARYPLLCSMVLVWSLLCGDIRLLPLAAAVLSFTAQQHLSVLPTVGVVTAVGTVGFLVAWGGQGRWRQAGARRDLLRWGGAAIAVALVLWTPIFYQQLFGDGPGNLTQMASFAQHDERPSLGMGSALRQAAHVLGLPPILGQLELSGAWLLAPVSPGTWVTAAAVAVAVTLLGLRWRRSHPRQAALVVAAGIVLVAGLVNGSSVPEGLEKYRLSLYHWAWPLTLFVVLSLGLGAIELVRRLPAVQRPWMPTAACGLAVVAIVVPAAVNPGLDRRSNGLMDAYSPVHRSLMDELAGKVIDGTGGLEGPIVLVERGQHNNYHGIREALAVALEERGLTTVHPLHLWTGVDVERLVDRDTVEGGLVLVVDQSAVVDEAALNAVPGELIAEADSLDFDFEAYDTLVAQLREGGPVELTDEAAQVIEDMPSAREGLFGAAVNLLPVQPENGLTNPEVLSFLHEHPLASPQLDAGAVERVLETLPGAQDARLRVYRLDRDELLDYARVDEVGFPPAETTDPADD